MTTHSLNSQAFRPRAQSLRGALRSLLAGWSAKQPTRRPIDDRAAEARRLREYAESVRSHDPRFAADLFAAADRHELQAETR
jgi:hypothetical protein